MLSLKSLFLISIIVLLGFWPAHSQTIAASQMLLAEYTEEGAMPDDVPYLAAVATVFGLNGQPVQNALVDPADTTFYACLKELLFYTHDTSTFKVSLYRIEKTGGQLYLKCQVAERIPAYGVNTIVGNVSLPFIRQGNSIKFKNYFKENCSKDFVSDGKNKIYTTGNNVKNFGRIGSFVKEVATKFGKPLNPFNRLYYAYYSADSNPYAAIGIQDYMLDYGARLLPLSSNDYLIPDKWGNGFYKHELTHYALMNNITSIFFNEGLATYMDGSSTKCNLKCDYEKFSKFLEIDKTDSLFLKILMRKYPYGGYYYPLAGISMQLLVEKYGWRFMDNKDLQAVLSSNSAAEMDAFLQKEFSTSSLPVKEYYLQKLKEYLSEMNKVK